MLTTSFRPSWKLTLFTLVMLPLMLRLGFWQLDREQEKIHLQAIYDSRAQMAPVAERDLPPADDVDALQYLPVRLQGNYDNGKTFLLDNRIVEGRVGYEVITPFVADTQVFFINRGWTPQGQSREQVPAIEPVRGTQDLVASVYIPLGETLMLAEETPFTGWPRLLQALDGGRMASEAGYEQAYPHVLRLEPGMAGVLTRHWPAINMGPEKHRGYAVQWFAMATMLFCLYLYACFRREEK